MDRRVETGHRLRNGSRRTIDLTSVHDVVPNRDANRDSAQYTETVALDYILVVTNVIGRPGAAGAREVALLHSEGAAGTERVGAGRSHEWQGDQSDEAGPGPRTNDVHANLRLVPFGTRQCSRKSAAARTLAIGRFVPTSRPRRFAMKNDSVLDAPVRSRGQLSDQCLRHETCA